MSAKEKYWEMSQEELFAKIDELEGKIVDYKKETKSTKTESLKTIEDLKSRIEELEKSNKNSENDNFLKDKKLSEDEKKIFEDKLAKGYDKEDAYLIATKESSKISENREEIWKNSLPWNDYDLSNTISAEEYNKIALNATKGEEWLKKFQEIDSKVISGKIKVIED